MPPGPGRGGGFAVSNAPNVFTVCAPVFSLVPGKKPGHFIEPAAFNARLYTEDFDVYSVVDGVQVVNPFRAAV